jgi:SAM-dependent methyltransferase
VTELVFELAPIAESLELPGLALGTPRVRRSARSLLRTAGRLRWMNLRRTTPVSAYWGFDRGTPVDRAYIERFLEQHAADIRGAVLEVADTHYTTAYGGPRVTTADVLDINGSNQRATVVADLDELGSLPAERFDCVLVTQTLQYVRNPEAALANLWQALAPGGSALITVPCTSRIDPDAVETDRWRFTPLGLETLFHRAGEWAELEVRGFGNVLSSAAFLMGFAAQDLRDRELDEQDAFFPLVVCARARKAPSRPA